MQQCSWSVKCLLTCLLVAVSICGMAQPLDPMVPINPEMADAKTLAA